MATGAKEPVGYLINGRNGRRGTPGAGMNYLITGNGLYVEAENRLLSARIPVCHGTLRGLNPGSREIRLRQGKIPEDLAHRGLRWMAEAPELERLFAIVHDGERYLLKKPEQRGTGHSLTYRPEPDTVAEFHSHAQGPAFFSQTDDQDEQGLRIYGVAGRLNLETPELALRIGVYGHFGAVEWQEIFEQGEAGKWRSTSWSAKE